LHKPFALRFRQRFDLLENLLCGHLNLRVSRIRSLVPLDRPTTQEARRIHSQMSRQLFISLCNRTNFIWRIEFGLVTLRDERQAHHGRT
jgi:hypothetical protein